MAAAGDGTPLLQESQEEVGGVAPPPIPTAGGAAVAEDADAAGSEGSAASGAGEGSEESSAAEADVEQHMAEDEDEEKDMYEVVTETDKPLREVLTTIPESVFRTIVMFL